MIKLQDDKTSKRKAKIQERFRMIKLQEDKASGWQSFRMTKLQKDKVSER
jgi:hypothetical protein